MLELVAPVLLVLAVGQHAILGPGALVALDERNSS
jgi:hypothetical protein